MVAVERTYQRRLARLDLVITEGSFMRKGGLVRTDPTTGRPFGHAGIPDLVEFFRERTPHIVITHFGSWFYKDIPDAVGRIEALGDGVRVSAAHDGLSLAGPETHAVVIDRGAKLRRGLGVPESAWALVVADRWGVVYDVVSSADESELPSADEIEEWFKFLATQCPECGVIDDPDPGWNPP